MKKDLPKHYQSIQEVIERYELAYLVSKMKKIEEGVKHTSGYKSSFGGKIKSSISKLFNKESHEEKDFEKSLMFKYMPYENIDNVKDIYFKRHENEWYAQRPRKEMLELRETLKSKIEDNGISIYRKSKSVITLDVELETCKKMIKEFDENLISSKGVINYDYIEKMNLEREREIKEQKSIDGIDDVMKKLNNQNKPRVRVSQSL